MNFKNPYGQQVPRTACCSESHTSLVNNFIGKAYDVVRFVASKIPFLESLLEKLDNQITYCLIIKGQMQITDFLIPYPDGITINNIQFSELWVFPKNENKYKYEKLHLTPEGLKVELDPDAPVDYRDMWYEWIILGTSESDIVLPDLSITNLPKNSYYGSKVVNNLVIPSWLQIKDLTDNKTIFFDNETGKFYVGDTLPSRENAEPNDVLQLDENKEPVWKKTRLDEILPIELGGTGRDDGLAVGLVEPRAITGNLTATESMLFDGSGDVQIAVNGILPRSKGGTGNTTGSVPLWNGSALFINTTAPTSADGKDGDIWIQLPS